MKSRTTAAWTKSPVTLLDDGSLEISGYIVDNPLIGVQLEDVNSAEFKGKLWHAIYREGLHINPNPGRVRAILLNMAGQSASLIMQALKEVKDDDR